MNYSVATHCTPAYAYVRQFKGASATCARDFETVELKAMNKSLLLHLKAQLLSFKLFRHLLLLLFNVGEQKAEGPFEKES